MIDGELPELEIRVRHGVSIPIGARGRAYGKFAEVVLHEFVVAGDGNHRGILGAILKRWNEGPPVVFAA